MATKTLSKRKLRDIEEEAVETMTDDQAQQLGDRCLAKLPRPTCAPTWQPCSVTVGGCKLVGRARALACMNRTGERRRTLGFIGCEAILQLRAATPPSKSTSRDYKRVPAPALNTPDRCSGQALPANNR